MLLVKRLSPPLIFLLFLILTCLIVFAINPYSIFVGVFVAVLFALMGRMRKNWFMPLLFFLLPFFGEFQRHLYLGVVPFELFIIFGFGVGVDWEDIFNRIKANPTRHGPFFWITGLSLLSLIVAAYRSGGDYLMNRDIHDLLRHMGWSIVFFLITVSGAVIYLLCGQLCHNKKSSVQVLKALMCGLTVSAFVGLIQYLSNELSMSGDIVALSITGRYTSTFTDANAMGIVTGMAVPMWISLCIDTNKKSFLPFGLGLFFLVFIAGSRSSFLLIGFSTILLVGLIKTKRGKIVVLLIVLASVFLSVILGKAFDKSTLRTMTFPDQLKNVAKAGIKTGLARVRKGNAEGADLPEEFVLSVKKVLNDRLVLWENAWITFKHNPVLGVGLGRYMIDMPKYKSEIKAAYNDNACNMYLQFAAEQGIIGLLVFLGILANVLYLPIKRGFKNVDPIQIAAFSSVVGLSAAFVFGSHILNAETNIFFWFLLALISYKSNFKGKQEKNLE